MGATSDLVRSCQRITETVRGYISDDKNNKIREKISAGMGLVVTGVIFMAKSRGSFNSVEAIKAVAVFFFASLAVYFALPLLHKGYPQQLEANALFADDEAAILNADDSDEDDDIKETDPSHPDNLLDSVAAATQTSRNKAFLAAKQLASLKQKVAEQEAALKRSQEEEQQSKLLWDEIAKAERIEQLRRDLASMEKKQKELDALLGGETGSGMFLGSSSSSPSPHAAQNNAGPGRDSNSGKEEDHDFEEVEHTT